MLKIRVWAETISDLHVPICKLLTSCEREKSLLNICYYFRLLEHPYHDIDILLALYFLNIIILGAGISQSVYRNNSTCLSLQLITEAAISCRKKHPSLRVDIFMELQKQFPLLTSSEFFGHSKLCRKEEILPSANIQP